EDIPLLATYFVAKHGKKSKRRVTGLSSEARACLLNYDWPGNVRELENAIERAVALGSTDVIMAEDLPESMLDAAHESSGATTKYHDALIEAKKKILLAALEQAQGSYKEAAKLLEIHPNNLHRLLRNLRISRTRRPE
ncbi:MAG TPA: helix-turn-helix domain-containing protein, partial [Acidobacteriota bacterium]|nr:helix-turn-helix domain-containing protein [Acidobacteriota bacterium]